MSAVDQNILEFRREVHVGVGPERAQDAVGVVGEASGVVAPRALIGEEKKITCLDAFAYCKI